MNISNTNKLRIYTILLILISWPMMSQGLDDPEFPFEGDPGTPEQVAPIDQCCYFLILIGVFLGFMILKGKAINKHKVKT